MRHASKRAEQIVWLEVVASGGLTMLVWWPLFSARSGASSGRTLPVTFACSICWSPGPRRRTSFPEARLKRLSTGP
jgi:hypothetical protein